MSWLSRLNTVTIPAVSNQELALSRTVLRSVQHRRSLLFRRCSTGPCLATQESIIALDLRFVAAVPLIGREGIMGVLYAAVLGDQESLLTESHFLPLLQTMANQAALILEMAQQTKDRTRSLSRDEFFCARFRELSE